MSLKKIILGYRLAQLFSILIALPIISVYHAQSIQFYIKLGHISPGPRPDLPYNQLRVKGEVGITRFEKVISLKTLLLLQIISYGHVTHAHCTCIGFTPSTKVTGLKIHEGLFRITVDKRSFSSKMLLLD